MDKIHNLLINAFDQKYMTINEPNVYLERVKKDRWSLFRAIGILIPMALNKSPNRS